MELYEAAGRLYSESAHNLTGMLGDDFRNAFSLAERLRNAADDVHNAILHHWRAEHMESASAKNPALVDSRAGRVCTVLSFFDSTNRSTSSAVIFRMSILRHRREQ